MVQVDEGKASLDAYPLRRADGGRGRFSSRSGVGLALRCWPRGIGGRPRYRPGLPIHPPWGASGWINADAEARVACRLTHTLAMQVGTVLLIGSGDMVDEPGLEEARHLLHRTLSVLLIGI